MAAKHTGKGLAAGASKALLESLRARFEGNMARHPGISWSEVRARLEAQPSTLRTLAELERTGGEPDLIAGLGNGGELFFVDCAPESPAGRRSLCYDQAALAARKEHKPKGSAVGLAAELGADLLTEAQYRRLQELGEFDVKTSSWLQTPAELRERGGAIFGDRRYGRVFTYHNGAESYYAARGFRCAVRV